jgi:hypothetical protein
MIRSILFLSSFCIYSFAQAQYPGALNNHNLAEEISDQEDRIVPKAEWATFAVDGQAYLRALESRDFYHALGYWIQARTEVRPSQFFTLNVRSIFYSGSVSGGYTEPTGTYHLVGLTGIWPKPVLGGTLMGRAVDLERQTIGYGLMIEEKEMAGLLVRWTRDSHSLKIIYNGTGGLTYTDDLANAQLDIFNGYIGAGVIAWTAGKESDLDKNRASLYYLTSGHDYENGLGYFIELGEREKKYAGLAGVKAKGQWAGLTYDSRLQARHYDQDFAKTFKRQIENVYISYDQYNKRYTNAANVFVVDDNVNIYSAIVDLNYAIDEAWSVQTLNEAGSFVFRNTKKQNFYYYRVAVKYKPLEGRQETITVFVSNKVLNDSYSRPPNDISLKNLSLFHQINFIGAEAAFRF